MKCQKASESNEWTVLIFQSVLRLASNDIADCGACLCVSACVRVHITITSIQKRIGKCKWFWYFPRFSCVAIRSVCIDLYSSLRLVFHIPCSIVLRLTIFEKSIGQQQMIICICKSFSWRKTTKKIIRCWYDCFGATQSNDTSYFILYNTEMCAKLSKKTASEWERVSRRLELAQSKCRTAHDQMRWIIGIKSRSLGFTIDRSIDKLIIYTFVSAYIGWWWWWWRCDDDVLFNVLLVLSTLSFSSVWFDHFAIILWKW